MSLVEGNGSGLSAADVAAVTGNNGFGFGGDGAWWLLVLFLFAFSGNFGWGGNGGGRSSEVQSGFDHSAVMNGITGLTSAVSNGFANAEISRCNAQTNTLQALNGIGMSLQNCCCENRAGLADLKYTVATENCADRTAVADGIRDVITNATANTQAILDKLCALELDGLKEKNAQLLADNNALRFSQSQAAQTAEIIANNAAQTAALRQALNPTPIPAYVVQNPSCCNQGYFGCNCGA